MTRFVAFIALFWFAANPASAQSVRLDDSASQVLTSMVRMKWEDPAPGRSDMQTGQVTVLVRIDTSPFRGRSGRIFHVLNRHATPIEVSWTARGPLLPGELREGERALVYAGPISTDLIEDTFVLTLRADANVLSRPEQLEFHFEFEADGT